MTPSRALSLLLLLLCPAPPVGGQEAGHVLYSVQIDAATKKGPRSVGATDAYGRSIAVIGDLNDDGVQDLAVGAPATDSGGERRGAVWIHLMQSDGSPLRSFRIGANRLTQPLEDHATFGKQVIAVGDLDGDGVEDLIASAPRSPASDQHPVPKPYLETLIVLFLEPDGSLKDEAHFSPNPGLWHGVGRGMRYLGRQADGRALVAVGLPGWKGWWAGGAVTHYAVDSAGTFTEMGPLYDDPGSGSANFGDSLGTLTDLDGDGVPELAVSAMRHDSESGSVWIRFADHWVDIDRADIPVLVSRERFGRSIACVGDIDKDGVDDLVVGANHEFNDEQPGYAYVLFMNSDGSLKRWKRFGTGEGGFDRVVPAGAEFGVSVEPIGDWNGDGIPDVAVGARFGGVNGGGAVYLCMLNDGTVTLPVADLGGAPRAGTAPLAVQFEDRSVGTYQSWLWDFGDGGTSTDPNPSHTYLRGGTYSVRLTVSGTAGSSTKTYRDVITVAPSVGPIAGLTAFPRAGYAPLEVEFQDLSVGSPTSWTWVFGDGASSNEPEPRHTFTTPGTYLPSLTVRDGDGASSAALTTPIVVHPVAPPRADFDGSPRTGTAPLGLSFVDHSAGQVEQWAWDFGDGTGSSSPEPQHSYTAPGTYTVSLTVSNAHGSSTETKAGFVSVGAPVAPTPNFAYGPSDGAVPLTVSFQDASSGPIETWLWDFGDGSTSSESSPTHVYTTPGLFDVKLTTTGPGGSTEFLRARAVFTAQPITVVFQEGDGVSRTYDTEIEEQDPATEKGSQATLRWDGVPIEYGLLRFDALFGTEAGRIPPGASILGATLELKVSEQGDASEVYELNVPWDESTTFNTLGNDPGRDVPDVGAFRGLLGGEVGRQPMDVSASLRRWSQAPATNHGWIFSIDIDNGVRVHSSEASQPSDRPRLSVTWMSTRSTPPASNRLRAGSFESLPADQTATSPWIPFGVEGACRVLSSQTTTGEALPTAGEHWLQVSSAGTSLTTPPSVPGGLTLAAQGGNGVRQTFQLEPGYSRLAFSAAMLLGEGDGLDWTSVDVSDGATTWNLFYRDALGAFPLVGAGARLARTSVENVSVDLLELFPSADEATVFVLSANAGNRADDDTPSFLWLDDVHFELTAVERFGCGHNPAGSLTLLEGEPRLGTRLVFGVDNPLGTQGGGALSTVFLAFEPAQGFPCGKPLSGFGMAGGVGALLFSRQPPNPVRVLTGEPWLTAGTPARVAFTLPNAPALAGRKLYVQGMLTDPQQTFGVYRGFTDGLILTLE